MTLSSLSEKPRSRVIKNGYINIYSQLNAQEQRQVRFKELYKTCHPDWDETLVFLTEQFRKLSPKDCVVLDAGCGNGNYVIDENCQNISRAVGVDVSQESVCKNICLDEIRIADLGSLPFQSESFDVVTSLWVLEHLREPQKVFSEIHRVLKRGGLFMFATPNKNFFPLKVVQSPRFGKVLNEKVFGRGESDIFPTYYQANSLDDLRSLAENRFEIIELFLNFDPSYTSFDNLSFRLSDWISQISRIKQSTHPHIIGIFKKV